MSERKFSAKRKPSEEDLAAFVVGAQDTPVTATDYPWENPELNERVQKSILLRTNEVFHAKATWAAWRSQKSLNEWIRQAMQRAFDEEYEKSLRSEG